MEADFSGYATKAGLKCSDGRTIMPDAFAHQDTMTVPLVWQHGHNNPENVLGHAVLENRKDGVYCYGFFNDSTKAKHTKGLIQHKDITMMSIWANDLIERAGRVLHGAIREVSLVLSGANPGAIIDNVSIRHSDGDEIELDDEAIIYTGLSFEHAATSKAAEGSDAEEASETPKEEAAEGSDDGDETVEDVYNSMTDIQKQVVNYLVGEALSGSEDDGGDSGSEDDGGDSSAQHDNMEDADTQDVYDSMNDNQKQLLHKMVGEALSQTDNDNSQEGTEMGSIKHNVFENTEANESAPVLSHDDMKVILADAARGGSLKDTVEEYALSHGIDNIGSLFPEVANITDTPQFLTRRLEWVAALLGAVNKSPFSRIKTINGDLTMADARAKGYVKGALKKEEFFNVTKRTTTPTTIYKKQKLDRDDIVDITDFDVVTWLSGEMRLMLDEEIARAILIGDGRDISDPDKINEQNVRPIASEHELYVTNVVVNTADAGSTAQEIIDAIIANRWTYKGTGTPTMFASETTIAKFLLLKDTLGRALYSSLDEIATVLRVSSIVPVEAMENNTTGLLAIIVNPVDYVVGATAGGQVNLFDFFDIDYNQQKYLIETRISGALTRLKSAIVLREDTNSSDTVVVPTAPTIVQSTGVVTIPSVTGVTYINADTGATLTAGAQPAIAVHTTLNVSAIATAGHFIASDQTDFWSFHFEG